MSTLNLYRGLFVNPKLQGTYKMSNKINWKYAFYNKKIQHQPKKQGK